MTESTITIYHNPRCSKSRQSLALLEDKGAAPRVVHYLDTPPTEAELKSLLRMLGLSPRELMRRGEAAYQENNLDKDSLSDDDLIRVMVANPILIERPIVVGDGKAVIGRPPERVLDLV